jgi:NaMN:DMB phosphoribosyltransferase
MRGRVARDTIQVAGHRQLMGRSAAARGLVCLGEIGIGNTTVAAALVCALFDVSPQEAVGPALPPRGDEDQLAPV